MALANQAKISPVKHEEIIDAVDDDNSMSTDEYNPTRTELNASTKTRTKSTRTKSGKSNSSSTKSSRQQAAADAIQYGPLLVKPRKSIAPTLANGRRSKDEPVSELKPFVSFFGTPSPLFSCRPMKITNVDNVEIETNKPRLNVVENETICVNNSKRPRRFSWTSRKLWKEMFRP